MKIFATLALSATAARAIDVTQLDTNAVVLEQNFEKVTELVEHIDVKPQFAFVESQALCKARDDKTGIQMSLTLRSWVDKNYTNSEGSLEANQADSVNALSGSITGMNADSPSFVYFVDACDGTTSEEEEFELKANERGRASIMETIDFTVDESLANGAENGPLSVDVRDVFDNQILCCSFKKL